MNRTSLKIKVLYDKMGKAEKKIADWLLDNKGAIIPLSIVELAEKCNCSEATIVRFAKRLGFSGYQELKISLARETKKVTISTNIMKEDSCYTVFEKVCNDIYCSLEKTKQVLDDNTLSAVAEKIANAHKIVIFGLGNSSSIAIDASHKLMRAGCSAYAYCDNHMQAIAASRLNKSDVAIGISHSGSSKDIVESLKLSKARGATTIAITNYGKSPIIKQSDLVLHTSSIETEYRILGLNSRIAQLAIIDALYFYIVYHNDAKAIKAIEDTEKALQNKKY